MRDYVPEEGAQLGYNVKRWRLKRSSQRYRVFVAFCETCVECPLCDAGEKFIGMWRFSKIVCLSSLLMLPLPCLFDHTAVTPSTFITASKHFTVAYPV